MLLWPRYWRYAVFFLLAGILISGVKHLGTPILLFCIILTILSLGYGQFLYYKVKLRKMTEAQLQDEIEGRKEDLVMKLQNEYDRQAGVAQRRDEEDSRLAKERRRQAKERKRIMKKAQKEQEKQERMAALTPEAFQNFEKARDLRRKQSSVNRYLTMLCCLYTLTLDACPSLDSSLRRRSTN